MVSKDRSNAKACTRSIVKQPFTHEGEIIEKCLFSLLPWLIWVRYGCWQWAHMAPFTASLFKRTNLSERLPLRCRAFLGNRCSGLTGPRPGGQPGSCPPHRPPCLPRPSSQACWGCCRCSQTRCPRRGKEALALPQRLTSPTKLRKAVSCDLSLRRKINGTWTKLSKVSRAAHPPAGKQTRAVVAQHIWSDHGLNNVWHN